MDVQVTLKATNGKYKAVSCIIHVKEGMTKKDIAIAGIQKICVERRWSTKTLNEYTYDYKHPLMRVYDAEKIRAENEARYAEIKRQKFASGEWTPSKKDMRKMMIEEIRSKK